MPDHLDDREVDERFADIIEHWLETAGDPGTAPNPALGGGKGMPSAQWKSPAQPESPTQPEAAPPQDADPLARLDPGWRMPSGGRSIDEILDDEEAEGFTPGEVKLPPSEDLHYWGAVIGLVVGPVIILWVTFGNPFYRTWWLVSGLLLVVGGFLLLVLRMPAHRDPSDDDDGARV